MPSRRYGHGVAREGYPTRVRPCRRRHPLRCLPAVENLVGITKAIGWYSREVHKISPSSRAESSRVVSVDGRTGREGGAFHERVVKYTTETKTNR